MNRERRADPETIFPGDFGVPFAPRDKQRQAGIAGEQLSVSAEIPYPPQGVEIKMLTSVPFWQKDARISAGTGLVKIGNALSVQLPEVCSLTARGLLYLHLTS